MAQGDLPTTLPYRVLLDLWQTSEAMLAACAQSKQRLIDFINDKAPDAPPPAKPSMWPWARKEQKPTS